MFRRILLVVALTILLGATSHAYDVKLLSEVPLKGKPTAIAVNSATDAAVVVSEATKTLSIINMISHAVTREVTLTATPTGVAVCKAVNLAVVSCLDGSLLLYNLTSGELSSSMMFGSTIYAVAVDESKNRAFLAMDGGIKVVDLSSGKVLSTIGSSGKNVALCADKSLAAVVSRDGADVKLRVIDLLDGKVTGETVLQGEAVSIGHDDSLGYLLVTLSGEQGLFIYDAASLKLIEKIPTGCNCRPNEVGIISVNPSTHMTVLAATTDGTLSFIDLAGKKVVQELPMFGEMGPVNLDTARNILIAGYNSSIKLLQLENRVPKISGLIPQEKAASEEGFPLTVLGEGFIKDSWISFAATLLESVFETNELVTATIPAEKLLTPGNVPVSVVNPPPGGGVSNELTFKVLTPAPQLSSIIPATAVVGSLFTLRVVGTNFLPTAVVNFNGKTLPTIFLSSTVLEAAVDAAFIPAQGSYPVSVTSHGPTSFTSNVKSLGVLTAEEAAEKAKRTAEEQTADSQGTGSLSGRILNTEMKPLKGVMIRCRNMTARTDESGSFLLENLPAGKRTILIDGSTAEEVEGHYPTIPISVNILAGVRNPMPFTPYFHRQKSRNFVNINPAKDTILTDPEVPGFEMRIPAGVNITGWDGKVNLKVSVRSVPTDRLPVRPLPPNSFARTVYMFYFNKVGGGKPDRPIPVKAPNDLGLLPGEKAVLWYYDESPIEGEAPNDWAIAGTGTVTPDGRFIVSDPGAGIPKFCCGATTFGGFGSGSPPSGPCNDDCCKNNNAGDPVNLATGYFIHEKTDYKVNGIIPFELKRFYRSDLSSIGAFGAGTYFGYDLWLGRYTDMLLLFEPGGYVYRFYKQPDGTFVNTTDPAYRGDIFYDNGNNIYTLKKKNGWSYKFGADRLLDNITDPNGNALIFLKQMDGNISTIILPDGRRINISYLIPGSAERDNITSITGPFGTVTYEYYNTGNFAKLKSVTYPDGSTISYTYDAYDASGRIATVTENGKLVVTNVYDTNHRVTRQTHPDGGVYTFNYTLAGGNLTETAMTSPNSATTTWRFYDDNGVYHNGYIAKITTPDGTTTYDLEPGSNLVKSVTDPLLRKTSYTYDAKGRRLTVTDPVGNKTGYQYEDACSNVSKIIDGFAKSTTFTHTLAAGTCRKTRTDIRDALQNLTVIEYDNYGKPTRITDPNNNATTLTYDPAHPERLTSLADPLGNTLRYGYDTLGRITSVTDAKGAKTTYGYDGITDRIASVTDTYGKTTGYAYDTSGNLAAVTTSKGDAIRYEYDDRNRIAKMTDQLERYETYAYYRNNEIIPTVGDNLKSYTDRKGQTTTFNQYDAMNRLKQVTFQDGSTVSYVYDAVGRATSIGDSISGTIGYTYETGGCPSCSGGVNGISQETTSLGTINYTYDANDRRASMTVAGEPAVTYGYDDAGRLTTISRNVGGTSRTYTLGYDGAGRRASVQIPIANGTDFVTTVYGYDIANRITSMLLQGPTAQIENLTYSYDPNGNRLSFKRSAAQATSPSVGSTSHDAANEMLALDGKTFTYDLNGNLRTRADVCGTTTYTWDARNRLTGISGYRPDCSSLTASFSYDAMGRRSSKTINGATTQYFYDGSDVIQESKDGVKTNYVRTPNIDDPLSRITNSTIRHYVKDALGSVMTLVDDSGITATTYVYDAFGNVTITGEGSDNTFQYTGRENDGTGLYYYRARYYSPEMQRFISEDPIRLSGGMNYFSYVQNNPVNNVDPTGENTITGGAVLGGFLEGPLGALAGAAIGYGVNELCKANDHADECDKRYYEVDIPTCRGVARKYGAEAGARCYKSASDRYSACLTGRPIPPLDKYRN